MRKRGGPWIKPEVVDRWSLHSYGCTHARAVELNGGQPLRTLGSKANRFFNTRKTRIASKIAFTLDFEAWCKLWDESGCYDLMGSGARNFVMKRIDKSKGFELGNVVIVRKTEAVSRPIKGLR